MEPLTPGHARWMPDAASGACLGGCTRPFTMFRRRHHCRACGRLICADCTGTAMLGRERRVHRVCAFTPECLSARAQDVMAAAGTAHAAAALPPPEQPPPYLQPDLEASTYTDVPLAPGPAPTGLPQLVL